MRFVAITVLRINITLSRLIRRRYIIIGWLCTVLLHVRSTGRAFIVQAGGPKYRNACESWTLLIHKSKYHAYNIDAIIIILELTQLHLIAVGT